MMTKKVYIQKRELNLNYTFNGGQGFRWHQNEDNSWIGVFAHRIWTLRQENDFLHYEVIRSTSVGETEEDEILIRHYFRLEESLSNLYEQWARCDPVFEKTARKFEGVRILRQDPIEILFTFICSSNNTIARMKLMVEKICELYGDRISFVNGKAYYDFPRIEKLAGTEVQNVLEEAKFGYRAKFIQQTARKIIDLGGLRWINELCKLPYEKAKAELMQLPGVGAKVADCICLESLNHLEAIPVDVHVFRIATTYYLPHLKGVKSVTDRIYKEIGDHFRAMYGKYAGWPHCVLFCDDLREFKEKSNDIDSKRKRSKNNDDSKKIKKRIISR